MGRTLQGGEGRESAEVRARQRELVLALSEAERVVSSPEVTRLNPALARLYARKTPKTVSRDLHALRDLGLIELSRAGARARQEIILAFLPPKRGANPAPPK